MGAIQGITIENSITNPNSNERFWIDNNEPLSFFDFLKHSKQIASPTQFNDSYNQYLHAWYEQKGEKVASYTTKIRDRYIDLLRDIAINFTTAEEKRFLNNIDFNNPEDIAIVVPFYSSKISEICQFYTRKREQIKYKIEDNKSKGTHFGIEKNIFNIIVEYILSDNGDQNTYNISNTALSSIINNLDIEIEEIFDTYSDYFNIDGDLSYENYEDGGLIRNTYFTSNNLIETSTVGDLFINFDESLKKDIFSKPLVLSGFGNLFSLRIDTSFLELVTNDNIQNILNRDLPETDLRLSLKKKLLEKYIGTDIYYLSTNSTGTDFVSGVLFKAESPSKNLLNSRFATVATAPYTGSKNKTARDIGLFFAPDKLGVLHFKTGKNKFLIKKDGLKADNIYVFPNPEIYGNISNITENVYDYPFYFVVDNSHMVKSNSFGFTINDVYNTSHDQLLYAYSSVQEKHNSYTRSISSLDSFNYIANKGIITDWHQDIFGNQYGLVKDIPFNRKNISYSDIESEKNQQTVSKCIVLDGHLFKDGYEGYNFNYSISEGETFNGNIRSGVILKTIDEPAEGNFDTGYTFASGEMFSLTGSPVRSLYFREFSPYIEAANVESFSRINIDGELCDGVGFMFGDDEFFIDPILADDEAFSTNIINYYSILMEAGLNSSDTLGAVPSGNASFLIDFPLSAAIAETNDGGSFLTDIVLARDYPYLNRELKYYNTFNNFSSTMLDTLTSEYIEPTLPSIERYKGIVFVQDVKSGHVFSLSSIMNNTFTNLPAPVVDEIYGNVEWIEVLYDSIFVQTTNYYIIEKIVYENGKFIINNAPNIYYISNDTPFNKFSKPFLIDDEISYFCRMTVLSANSASNSKAIFPEIYEYNLNDHTCTKVYPVGLDESELNYLYSLSGLGDINIDNIKQPDLVYNSRNDIISITVVGEDGNELSYIVNYKYRKTSETINYQNSKAYRLNTNGVSHNFYDSTLTTFVSSTSLSGNIVVNSTNGALFFN